MSVEERFKTLGGTITGMYDPVNQASLYVYEINGRAERVTLTDQQCVAVPDRCMARKDEAMTKLLDVEFTIKDKPKLPRMSKIERMLWETGDQI